MQAAVGIVGAVDAQTAVQSPAVESRMGRKTSPAKGQADTTLNPFETANLQASGTIGVHCRRGRHGRDSNTARQQHSKTRPRRGSDTRVGQRS